MNYQLVSFIYFISPLHLPPLTLLTPHHISLFCSPLLSSSAFFHLFIVHFTNFRPVGSSRKFFFELPTCFVYLFQLSSASVTSNSSHSPPHFTLLLSSSLFYLIGSSKKNFRLLPTGRKLVKCTIKK